MEVVLQVGLDTPGAAWQAALEAASEVGSQQLLLVDRPTVVTERKLADTLLQQSGEQLLHLRCRGWWHALCQIWHCKV